MTNKVLKYGLLALSLTVAASTAEAHRASYRVEANGEGRYTLTLCGRAVDISVEGDGDTDLDFWIYDSAGRLIHSDTDLTDRTYKTVYRGVPPQCGRYEMVVENLGDVWNEFELRLNTRR
jgi:hypothetical protein